MQFQILHASVLCLCESQSDADRWDMEHTTSVVRLQLGAPAIAYKNIKVHALRRRREWIRRGSSSCANEARRGFCWSIPKVRKGVLYLFFMKEKEFYSFQPLWEPCLHPSSIAPHRLSSNLFCCASCLLPPFFPSQTNFRHATSKESSYPGISDGETLFFLLKTFHAFSF